MAIEWTPPPAPAPRKYVWEMDSGPDTFIAESEEECWTLWSEHCCEDSAQYRDGDSWNIIDDEQVVEVGFENREDVEQQLREAEGAGCNLQLATVIVRTRGLDWLVTPSGRERYLIAAPAEWWAQLPVGFLCSTEY